MTYEQKCLELDKELAELLGWYDMGIAKMYTNNTVFVGRHKTESDGRDSRLYIPRWTQDDAAAFRLAVEHDITVDKYPQRVDTYSMSNDFTLSEPVIAEYANFSDKLSAVRYAIVQAVVNKLKGN